MDYQHLTLDDRRNMVLQRIKGLEAKHYNLVLDRAAVLSIGSDGEADKVTVQIEALESAIAVATLELDGLGQGDALRIPG